MSETGQKHQKGSTCLASIHPSTSSLIIATSTSRRLNPDPWIVYQSSQYSGLMYLWLFPSLKIHGQPRHTMSMWGVAVWGRLFIWGFDHLAERTNSKISVIGSWPWHNWVCRITFICQVRFGWWTRKCWICMDTSHVKDLVENQG